LCFVRFNYTNDKKVVVCVRFRAPLHWKLISNRSAHKVNKLVKTGTDKKTLKTLFL
jgi:hypothetical protein